MSWSAAQAQQLLLVMRAEVVEHHDEVLVEACPQRAEQLAHLAPGLGGPDVAIEPAARRVVGGEQMADAGGPLVGGPEADRMIAGVPALSEHGWRFRGPNSSRQSTRAPAGGWA